VDWCPRNGLCCTNTSLPIRLLGRDSFDGGACNRGAAAIFTAAMEHHRTAQVVSKWVTPEILQNLPSLAGVNLFCLPGQVTHIAAILSVFRAVVICSKTFWNQSSTVPVTLLFGRCPTRKCWVIMTTGKVITALRHCSSWVGCYAGAVSWSAKLVNMPVQQSRRTDGRFIKTSGENPPSSGSLKPLFFWLDANNSHIDFAIFPLKRCSYLSNRGSNNH